MGNPSKRAEIPLNPQVMLQSFDKWAIDFVGPINPQERRSQARYIINLTEYLTIWEEETPITDGTTETTARFLFDNLVTRFGCLHILLSDQGTNFINNTISTLTEEL